MSKRIVIAGGRDYDDYKGLCNVLNKIRWNKDDEIVSGTARGADSLGERYARENKIKLTRFPARWDQFGRKAGFTRNAEMAKYCTGGIVFWDGHSRGSRSMIYLLAKENKPCKIVKYMKLEVENEK